ncbi:hypothetical protein MDAP_002817 [Mitosporidium daphniae]
MIALFALKRGWLGHHLHRALCPLSSFRILTRAFSAYYARIASRTLEPEGEDCNESITKGIHGSEEPAKTASNAEGAQSGVIYHYFELKEKYPLSDSYLLLYQIGEFYEFYGPDALVASRVLGLGLTTKKIPSYFGRNLFQRFPKSGCQAADDSGRSKPSLPVLYFTGIPVASFQAGSHMRKLVTENTYKLVICDQFPSTDPSSGRNFERKISRIITPGTLSEDSVLSASNNNFLLAISGELRSDTSMTPSPLDESSFPVAGRMGLAWIDISTGDISFASTTLESIEQYLVKLSPTEILVSQQYSAIITEIAERVSRCKGGNPICITLRLLNLSPNARLIVKRFSPATREEELALTSLVEYVQETQVESATTLFNSMAAKHFQSRSPPLTIDSQAFRALEILTGSRTGTEKGSLFGTLNMAQTPMGARLLSQWLQAPLTDVSTIRDRLDGVEFFFKDLQLVDNIRGYLKELTDLERHLNTIILRRDAYGSLRHLSSIRKSLICAKEVLDCCAILSATGIEILAKAMDGLSAGVNTNLCAFLGEIIVDDPPHRLSEGNFISISYPIAKFGPALAAIREKKGQLKKEIGTLEAHYRTLTGVSALKIIEYRNNYMLVEVPLRDGPLTEPIFVQETKTAQYFRYQTAELNALCSFSETHQEESLKLEMDIYKKICEQMITHAPAIRALAKAFAILDLLTTMARVATIRGYVRPDINEGTGLSIFGGRHPVVELGLTHTGIQFVKNDCILAQEEKDNLTSTKGARFALITGPNMGGKSTFLRQTALIVLMAQCGFFVPADSARIGITDAIFTRIGSSDSLTTNESTFMLEMKETAAILKHATKRSLVIVDEIGRGTSPSEGKAIARAVAQYLIDMNRSRVLFATHFYAELVDGISGPFFPPKAHGKESGEAQIDFVDQNNGMVNSGIMADHEMTPDGSRKALGPNSSPLGHKSTLHRRNSAAGSTSSPIVFWKTSAITNEFTKSVIFLHHIVPGLASTSNSVQVARLAGIPESILRNIESDIPEHKQTEDLVEKEGLAQKKGLAERNILCELQKCDLDAISARSALQLLFEWRRRLDGQYGPQN